MTEYEVETWSSFHHDEERILKAQEEAEHLYSMFLPFAKGNTLDETKHNTKQCAIAAARVLKRQYLQLCTVKGPAKPTHWDLVKQEIEKL